MSHARWLLLCSLLGTWGCSSGDEEDGPDDSVTLMGTTGCEKLDSLSIELGCTTRCSDVGTLSAECDAKLAEWMDCIAQDLSQCLCEPDGSLNCEGSHKPDEGPALCRDVFAASESCF
jgi:hypothetical protein